ncbi:MAG: hypothetical protein IPH35_21615 [Rhodoferax sp.]|nr:hypothetical protein [Rhodoferax sp.]
MTELSAAQRHIQRHNEISIRLHYAWGNDWHVIEAQQWSARGFCFFHVLAVHEGAMEFKRSLQHFSGDIVWTRTCHDEEQVLEMLLNEIIHQQAQRLQNQPEMQQRLLRLMRVRGMAQDKQRVLSALGLQLSQAQWQERVQQRLQEAFFQSGVRVESPVWNAVVADAIELGSVVQDLERWSGALGGDE